MFSHRAQSTRKRFAPRLEVLEDRTVPATLAGWPGGMVYTAGADVQNSLQISYDAVTRRYTFRDVERINVFDGWAVVGNGTTSVSFGENPGLGFGIHWLVVVMGNRHDTVAVSSLNDPLTVHLGAGNDFLTVNAAVSLGVEANGGNGNDCFLGGSGSDTFRGNAGNDILVGGAGNDRLFGGDNRDVLIGGAGSDELRGQHEADLMIGGTTTHDADVNALTAILAEWGRDAGYLTRLARLRSGGGLNGSSVLTTATVFDDGAVDLLVGGSGRDWFWGTRGGDFFVDRDSPREQLN